MLISASRPLSRHPFWRSATTHPPARCGPNLRHPPANKSRRCGTKAGSAGGCPSVTCVVFAKPSSRKPNSKQNGLPAALRRCACTLSPGFAIFGEIQPWESGTTDPLEMCPSLVCACEGSARTGTSGSQRRGGIGCNYRDSFSGPPKR